MNAWLKSPMDMGIRTLKNGRSAFPILLAGALFALGLALSGMTRPEVVLGFLNIFGDWNPSLAFVMVGAIGSHLVFLHRSREMPLTGSGLPFPARSRRSIDRQLVLGSALFGVGWGMSGMCPGPGLVSLSAWSGDALLFTGAMLLGMRGYRHLASRS